MTDEPDISKIRRTSIYLSKELLKRLKNAAAEREVSVNTILLEAIEMWLGSMDVHDRMLYFAHANRIEVGELIKWMLETYIESQNKNVPKTEHQEPLTSANLMAYAGGTSQFNATSSPQEFEPWLSYLLHILRENNAYAAPSIKKNLEAFERLTNLDGGANAPPPTESAEDAARAAKANLDAANEAAKKHLDRHRGGPGKRGKIA